MASLEYTATPTLAGLALAREGAEHEAHVAVRRLASLLKAEGAALIEDWMARPAEAGHVARAESWWDALRVLPTEVQVEVKCDVAYRVGYLPPMGLGR